MGWTDSVKLAAARGATDAILQSAGNRMRIALFRSGSECAGNGYARSQITSLQAPTIVGGIPQRASSTTAVFTPAGGSITYDQFKLLSSNGTRVVYASPIFPAQTITVGDPLNFMSILRLPIEEETVITVLAGGSAAIDDRPAIQEALDVLRLAGGGTLRLPSPIYYIGPNAAAGHASTIPGSFGAMSLRVGSGTTVDMGDETVIRRRVTAGGTPHATFTNYNAPSSLGAIQDRNITIRGGVCETVGAYTGKHFCFYNVDGLTLDRTKLRGVHQDWNAYLANCSNVLIESPDWDSGDEATEDGLHLSGCTNVQINKPRIKSGDDAIAVVNEGPVDGFAAVRDQSDIVVNGGSLHSRAANAIRVHIATASDTTISRLQFNNINCKAGPDSGTPTELVPGIQLVDAWDEMRISRITMRDVDLDASTNKNVGFQLRGVKDSIFENVTIDQPYQRSMGDFCSNIRFINYRGLNVRSHGAPGDAGPQQSFLWGEFGPSTDIYFENGEIIGGEWCLFMGGAGGAVDKWGVSGMKLSFAAQNGIAIYQATNGVVTARTSVKNCGGQAIVETATGAIPSNNNYVFGNDLNGQTNGANDGAFMVGAGSWPPTGQATLALAGGGNIT